MLRHTISISFVCKFFHLKRIKTLDVIGDQSHPYIIRVREVQILTCVVNSHTFVLQYIIGNVGFYREEYLVTPDCLIPRADTEILVDYAVKHLPVGARFADLCTGSGCVAISTLKNTKNTTAVAVDISSGALDVARKNAKQNGVSDRLTLTLADVKQGAVCEGIFALLSNPPYVRDDVYPTLDGEIFHEPKIAFVGGRDGGDFYRRITEIYRDIIDRDGFIAYEIGYDQAELLREIAEQNRMSCEIIKDLSGNDRVSVLRVKQY